MNLICRIFGHSWRYNFPPKSKPSKRICSRCMVKQLRRGWFLGDDYFVTTFNFEDKRTDKELINKWFK